MSTMNCNDRSGLGQPNLDNNFSLGLDNFNGLFFFMGINSNMPTGIKPRVALFMEVSLARTAECLSMIVAPGQPHGSHPSRRRPQLYWWTSLVHPHPWFNKIRGLKAQT